MSRTPLSIATIALLAAGLALFAGQRQGATGPSGLSGTTAVSPDGAAAGDASESTGHHTAPTGQPPSSLADLPRAEAGRLATRKLTSEDIYEIRVGPLDFPRDMHHLRLPIQLTTIDIDGWMHGFTWTLTDGEGRKLPDELLHHVNLIDPDRRELFAPVPRRVMAAGRETRSPMLPKMLGYPLEPGTRLLVAAMFTNQTERSFEDVYLRIRLRYTEEDDVLVRPRDVFPFHMDVMGLLGEKSFAVPPGRTERSWEGSPAIDGRILALTGHMHDYAERIRLDDVTTGRTLWESAPHADREGRVYSVPTKLFLRGGGIPIRRDHTYRVTVVYRSPLDHPAPDGGMGVVAGAVVAGNDAEWPGVDRDHPNYVADLRTTLRKPFESEDGRGGHGGRGAH